MTIQVQPPTKELISKAVSEFDSQNEPIEAALSKLFTLYPRNSDLSEVLLKVVALNRLYSTQIYAVLSVAEHIQEHADAIDAGLAVGSAEVVDIIMDVPIQGKVHTSSRSPRNTAVGIAESYTPFTTPGLIGTCGDCNGRMVFSETFKKDEYADYSQFRDVMIAFRKKYRLDAVSFKNLDNFIWLNGDRASLLAELRTPPVSADGAGLSGIS